MPKEERDGYRTKYVSSFLCHVLSLDPRLNVLKQQLQQSNAALQTAQQQQRRLLEVVEGCSNTAEGLTQQAQRKASKVQGVREGLLTTLHEAAGLQGAVAGLLEELATTREACEELRARAAAAEALQAEEAALWEGRCQQLQGALAELRDAYVQVCEQGGREEGEQPRINAGALARLKRRLAGGDK